MRMEGKAYCVTSSAQPSPIWHGTAQHGQYSVLWKGSAQHSMAQHSTAWLSTGTERRSTCLEEQAIDHDHVPHSGPALLDCLHSKL